MKRSIPILAALAIGLLTLAQAAPTTPSPAVPPSQKAIPPFFQEHCFECHDADTQKGNLQLDNLPLDFSNPIHARKWIDVFDKISAGEMPPKKQPRPPEAARRDVLASIQSGLTSAELTRRSADGRVVLRRLNRSEYENTIRDLLSIDVDVKDLLPEDSPSMGFDNIAAALNVSSVLMERYVEAADVALDAAIQSGPQPPGKTLNVPYGPATTNPADFRYKQGVEVLPDKTFVIYNSGDLATVCDAFRAPVDGLYRFRVPVWAYRAQGQSVVMCLMAGSFNPSNPRRRTLGYFDITAAADNPRIIEFEERLPRGGTFKILTQRLGKRTLNTPEDVQKYTGPGLAVGQVHIEGPIFPAWPPEAHRRLFGDLVLKTATAADLPKVLQPFATRAFRRPLAPNEIAPYVALAQAQLNDKQPFEDAIRVALKAILCSPEFLFLKEKPGQLDDYAIASRLSYFLWSSMPDQELLELAANHSLATPDILRQQTQRLLDDPKSRNFTDNFTGQWLGLRNIDFTTPDKKLYPEFDDMLQWSMVEETHRFFDEILQHDLSLLNFIQSDFSILNDRLAQLYHIDNVTGVDFRKVALPANSHRGGVLGMAAILKITANGTSTSPVVRGAWVMRNLLGKTPKPPPPNIPAVEPDVRGAKTIRQQLEKHRSQTSCATCHANIDPPGCALENFDVIGAWRENYRSLGEGKPTTQSVDGRRVGYKIGPRVDAADTLPDGRAFADIDQFKQLILADKNQIARCLAEKLLVYSTGAALDFVDRESLSEIVRHTADHNYGFKTLVHEVVQSKVFLTK